MTTSPNTEHRDVVLQQVQELEEQAQSYLASPTDTNLKRAISYYQRILSFSALDDAEKARYHAEIQKVQQTHEEFRAIYGELTTARQVANQEEELIAIRKLMLTGHEFGPDGEDLAARFAELLPAIRSNLVKMAGEQVSLARSQAEDSIRYLDIGPLDAAIESCNKAVRLLEGKEIVAPDNTPDTTTAIQSTQPLLQDDKTEQLIQEYTTLAREIEAQRSNVVRVRHIYDEASDHFAQGSYEQAVAALDTVPELAGNNFWSPMVQGLRSRSLQRWEDVSLPHMQHLLANARTAADLHQDDQVQHIVKEILHFEPHLKTDQVMEYRQQARVLLDELGQRAVQKREEQVRADQETAQSLIDKAIQMMQEQQYVETLRVLHDAHLRDPDNRDVDSIGYEVRPHIVQLVEQLKQAEQQAANVSQLRESLWQRSDLQRQMADLGPAFVLNIEGTLSIDVQTLDTWEQCVHDGPNQIQQASETYTSARDAEAANNWQAAVAFYRQAEQQYARFLEKLIIPPGIDDTLCRDYPLVRELRDETWQMQTRAEEKQHEVVESVQRCYQQIEAFRAMLRQAQAALDNDEFVQAQALAEDVIRLDAHNREHEHEARRIIWAATQNQDEANESDVLRHIVLGVLAVALLVLAFIYGPGLWNWFGEMFFSM
jgi:tetratricopeptide (TPR) repeat protein